MLELIDGRSSRTPVHIPRPRPAGIAADPEGTVRTIVDAVRLRGDDALIEFTDRFDSVRLTPERIRVDEDTVAKSRSLVPPELIDAFEVMAARLRRTCERQLPEGWMEDDGDEFSGELVRPLRRVGIYAPGGRASYPSTVIMAAVPAQTAGVDTVAVCSPPGLGGEIPDAILAACSVVGVDEVYRMGGAQAVAAFAYGTSSVRPVDKIVGPGNIYVTLAKRAVRGWVGTDSEAGPTEIAIVADEDADAAEIAADLVAQAEHGPLGTHALITWAPELAEAVIRALDTVVMGHERPEDVENALIEGGRAVLVQDLEHGLETANAFAPEHLELIFAGAMDALDRVRNAGSVFIGRFSPVAVGDYVGGTNHVLPTGGSARWQSGLSVRDFVKHVYVSGYERTALQRLAPHLDALAHAEGLAGHSRSVELRLADEE
ncbi:MAG TPA: histidinol dehydrogenase [Actinomycetota bacterium]|nr:histidinol dehydrogenase [Actinomycetota bacterium]